jgi:hypothetical protein
MHGAAVEHGAVSDTDIVANSGRMSRVGVDDGGVLNIAVRTDDYVFDVCPHDGAVKDSRSPANRC